MLMKGVITKKVNSIYFVWSKELYKEALLDERSKPEDELLGVGSWMMFDVDEAGFVNQYTQIPNLLPSRVNSDCHVEVKTIISFPINGGYNTDVLAYSEDLGRIGIFRNFENLSPKEHYDVWVARIPTLQANLERYFNVIWCISEESPVRRRREIGEAYFAYKTDSSHSSCTTNENISGISSEITERVCPPTVNVMEASSRYGALPNRDVRLVRLAGVVTAFYQRIGFLWCPELGEAIITNTTVVTNLDYGDWVEAILSVPLDYTAKDAHLKADYFGHVVDDTSVVRRFLKENGPQERLVVCLTKQNPLKFYGVCWKVYRVIRPVEVNDSTTSLESSQMQNGNSES